MRTTLISVIAALSAACALAACSSDDEPAAEPEKAATATCTLEGKPVDVEVTTDSDAVTVTFSGQPTTGAGAVGLFVSLWENENKGAQLGMKFDGGAPAGYFVFDLSGVEQVNMDGEPEVDGDTVTGTFPRAGSALDGLAAKKWSAVLSINGDDVAGCPDLEYSSQPFPG